MGRAKKKASRKRASGKKAVRRKATRKSARPRGASRKKAAGKKAAKKKAAKKSARRKSTGARSGGGRQPQCTIVDLDPQKPLGTKKTHLSKSLQECVVWNNKDTVDHRIHFTKPAWPFVGGRRDILVRAGKTSDHDPLYVSNSNSAIVGSTHDYEVITPIQYTTKKEPPPDGPAVIVNG